MRKYVSAAAIAALAMTATAASAQDAGNSDVAGYLCTFAGKCGDEAAEEETRTAPATKGFSLARTAKPQDTKAAPDTKGFSLARKPQQQQVAPDTKGFSIARTPAATKAAATKRPAAARPAVATRPARPTARPVAAAPAAGPRADLMLTFELNSATMTSGARDRAAVFAQALNAPELRNRRFLIEGHTDSVGGRSVNLDLSQRRAQSVADYLISQGIDRSRLEVKGFGPDRPLPGKSARAGENRRVEAVLIS